MAVKTVDCARKDSKDSADVQWYGTGKKRAD